MRPPGRSLHREITCAAAAGAGPRARGPGRVGLCQRHLGGGAGDGGPQADRPPCRGVAHRHGIGCPHGQVLLPVTRGGGSIGSIATRPAHMGGKLFLRLGVDMVVGGAGSTEAVLARSKRLRTAISPTLDRISAVGVCTQHPSGTGGPQLELVLGYVQSGPLKVLACSGCASPRRCGGSSKTTCLTRKSLFAIHTARKTLVSKRSRSRSIIRKKATLCSTLCRTCCMGSCTSCSRSAWPSSAQDHKPLLTTSPAQGPFARRAYKALSSGAGSRSPRWSSAQPKLSCHVRVRGVPPSNLWPAVGRGQGRLARQSGCSWPLRCADRDACEVVQLLMNRPAVLKKPRCDWLPIGVQLVVFAACLLFACQTCCGPSETLKTVMKPRLISPAW